MATIGRRDSCGRRIGPHKEEDRMRILPILAALALAGGLAACTRTTYVERPVPAPTVVQTPPPATVVTPAPTVTVRPTY
jgi:hypothetical protein